MALVAGTKLGPYEILSPLGAGGMGEVYRARDTRLDRTVAVKILPSHLSDNTDAQQRFEREARAISSLSHPNICHLYDVGSQNGTHYLVMEFLEGETLALRLSKGPLPLDQVLKYGVEICEGLEKAHRTGVVHRDLKPGNIMITKTGTKLMDFGLAKSCTATDSDFSGATATLSSPAVSQPLTARGTVLGTFQYMSPEQVEGKDVDARSDIFSFGAVLYEMATGKRAFDGKSQISVASAILEKEPEPILAIQPMAPAALDHVIRGCLAKDRDSRWQSAADIARELRWITSTGSQAAVALPVHLRRRIRERFAWAAIIAALFAVIAVSNFRERPGPRIVRAYLLPPKDAAFDFMGDFSGPPMLSPDGTQVAFCAHGPKDQNTVWVQSLDNVEAKKLEGTEGASFPFWSADGKFIAFFAEGKLKKTPASGGLITILADAPNARGGAWSKDNVILYSPDYRESLWRVNAAGGSPARVTQLDPNRHTTHRWPAFLPDGKHFLYFATSHSGGNQEQNGIYLGSLDSELSKLVMQSDSGAQYASGYLLFHLQTAIMAQKFDGKTGVLSGDPIPIANHIQYDSGTWRTTFSASEDGVLLYESGSSMQGIDLNWYDTAGKLLGSAGERAQFRGMRISPDGKRLAVSVGDPKPDIWVFDLARGSKTRLTFDPASHFMPSWSPDGQRVAFMSQNGPSVVSGSSLYARIANGGGQDELLMEPENPASPESLAWPQWSPDGRYLIYQRGSGPAGFSVWAVPTTGDKKAFRVVQPQTPQARIVQDRISPDGRWLAYTSTDTGREELYVTPFPGASGKWQVSQNGGTSPVWSPNGKELYYLGTDTILHVAEVHISGNQFEVANLRPLFPIRYVTPVGIPFDVSPDGKRILVPSAPENVSPPMTLVLNWTAELSK
jgi:Tol biopolymer transport system component